MSKDKFKHTSSDLEDGLTEVEKYIWVDLGLHQGCEHSESSHSLSQNLYALVGKARIKNSSMKTLVDSIPTALQCRFT